MLRLKSLVPTSWLVPALCAGLFLGTFVLFSRSAGFGFLNYDDPRYVTQNPHVQAGITWEGVEWAFTGKSDYWHPLTWIAHMADWQLFGPRAAGHHLVCVFWHALNAALAFLVLRRLTGACLTSALAAALFAWHPLRVESVAWITERKDVMSGFFFLLTLLAYAGYADRRRDGRPAGAAYGLTLAAFLGGLMCKPMLVTLPLVLLLLDYWPLRRLGEPGAGRRRIWEEKIPFFALSAAVGVVTVWMQTGIGAFTLRLPLGARLANACVSIPRYLGSFAWPFDLAVCYPHPGHWPWPAVAGAAVLVPGITLAAVLQRKERPWLLVGWGWFLIMLLPVIGIVQVGFQSMADRYTYLPILGVEIALLWTLREALASWRPRWPVAAAAIALLAGGAARTWDQEAVWQTPTRLFGHALAVTGRNPMAHFFLGATLLLDGKTDAAEAHTRKAVAEMPEYPPALELMAEIHLARGRMAEAADCYRRILRADPRNVAASCSLGAVYIKANRLEEAAALFRPAALAGDAGAQFGLATVNERLGRLDEALTGFRAVIRQRPAETVAHFKIGQLLLARQRPGEAADSFKKVVKLQPNFAPAHLGLGVALEQLGRPEEAFAEFRRALETNPAATEVHRAWGDALARSRRFDEAVVHYKEALRLNPRDAIAEASLGFALFATGRRDEAAGHWEQALRIDPNIAGLRDRIRRARAPE